MAGSITEHGLEFNLGTSWVCTVPIDRGVGEALDYHIDHGAEMNAEELCNKPARILDVADRRGWCAQHLAVLLNVEDAEGFFTEPLDPDNEDVPDF